MILSYLLLVLFWSTRSVAGQFTVTILSDPPGIPVDDQPNTFDYPILSSVTLTCMVTSSDGSPLDIASYRWRTTGCYTNAGHRGGKARCFPNGQTTQIVSENDLTAEDAGTIRCEAYIGDGVYHISNEITLRISELVINLCN
ncbi:uncharacterized protein [Dysidea avara]|uniref:uncharacterized protein n=1 Tax=Dysidea avara TaxID=196820 RepID=UPI00333188EC